MKKAAVTLCVVCLFAVPGLSDVSFQLVQTVGFASRPWKADCADLNSDGDLDLVVAAESDGSAILWNRGDGTFSDPDRSAGLGSGQAVSAGDLDGDGDIDFVLAGYPAGLSVWRNDGGRGFRSHGTLAPGKRTWAMGLGDLDGDLDFVIAGGNTADSVWLNDGQGRFTPTESPFVGDQGLCVLLADLDGDGDLDAVFCHDAGWNSTNKVYIWRNDR